MFWVPVQKELIKACRKDSWYIYKVMSSRMPDLPFDYVRFNVFHDIEQTKNPYIGIQEFIQRVYPDKETADQLEKTNSTRFMLWEQLYEIRSKTKSWLLHPAIFLQIAPTDLTSDQQGLVGLKSLDRITEKTKWNMLSLKKVNRSSHSDYLLELVVSAHK